MVRTVGGNASATTIFSKAVQAMCRTVGTEMAVRKTHPVPAVTMTDSGGNASRIRRTRGIDPEPPESVGAKPSQYSRKGSKNADEDGGEHCDRGRQLQRHQREGRHVRKQILVD